jgi:hypothetical protein
MTMRFVKLAKNAREKALELGVAVGVLQDEGAYERAMDAAKDNDGFIQVRNRDYQLLEQAGLLDEKSEARMVAPAADQPEAEAAQAQAKRDNLDDDKAARDANVDKNAGGTLNSGRGPSGTDRGVHPGGVGHQPDDAYSNADRVQGEIQQDQERGAKARADQDLGSVKDEELDEALRRDGRLPEGRDRDAKEQDKQQKQAEREDKKAEKEEAEKAKARDEIAKKDQAEHEKAAKQASGEGREVDRKDEDRPKTMQKTDQRTGGRVTGGTMTSEPETPDRKSTQADKK